MTKGRQCRPFPFEGKGGAIVILAQLPIVGGGRLMCDR